MYSARASAAHFERSRRSSRRFRIPRSRRGVFAEGTYTIRLYDRTYDKALPGVLALSPAERKTLEVDLAQ